MTQPYFLHNLKLETAIHESYMERSHWSAAYKLNSIRSLIAIIPCSRYKDLSRVDLEGKVQESFPCKLLVQWRQWLGGGGQIGRKTQRLLSLYSRSPSLLSFRIFVLIHTHGCDNEAAWSEHKAASGRNHEAAWSKRKTASGYRLPGGIHIFHA